MILVTVGTQIPFDRLVQSIDQLAPRLSIPAFAQIGVGQHRPVNIEFCESMRPEEFDRRFREASIIVSHAGIGTVLAAMKYRKPIIVMPRRASLGEHRNDHQLATCAQLQGRPGIYIAEDTDALETLIMRNDLVQPDEAALAEHRQVFVGGLRDRLQALAN